MNPDFVYLLDHIHFWLGMSQKQISHLAKFGVIRALRGGLQRVQDSAWPVARALCREVKDAGSNFLW